jgi:hypothetical protein
LDRIYKIYRINVDSDYLLPYDFSLPIDVFFLLTFSTMCIYYDISQKGIFMEIQRTPDPNSIRYTVPVHTPVHRKRQVYP